jgi:hypothetical protein
MSCLSKEVRQGGLKSEFKKPLHLRKSIMSYLRGSERTTKSKILSQITVYSIQNSVY